MLLWSVLSTACAGKLPATAEKPPPAAQSQALARFEKWAKEIDSLSRQGAYQQALSLAHKSLQQAEQILGPEHADLAVMMANTALVYSGMGQGDKAQNLIQRAIEISRKGLGPQDLQVGHCLELEGHLYAQLGQYDRAGTSYDQAMEILSAQLGPKHLDLAGLMHNMGRLKQRRGQLAAAQKLLQDSLEIRKQALGPEHPLVAESLNSLSGLKSDQGDFSGARALLEQSLTIQEHTLGPAHIDLAIGLNNLAFLLLDEGRYAEARPYFERSLAIKEKLLSPGHSRIGTSVHNLAHLAELIGDYQEAETLFQRALRIKESALGPEHLDVARILNNLGLLRNKLGDRSAARSLLARSHAIRVKQLGPHHPLVAVSFNNLAQCEDDPIRLQELYEQALKIWQEKLGPEHPNVATALGNLALVAQMQGQPARAQLLFARSLAIREKKLGPSHPRVADSISRLAMHHWGQGDLAQARSLMTKELALVEKHIDPLLDATSERERIALIRSRRDSLHRFLSLFSRSQDHHDSYRALMRWKGVVANSLAAQRAAILELAEPQNRAAFQQLRNIRRKLAALAFTKPKESARQSRHDRILALTAKKEGIERELAIASRSFHRQRSLAAAGLDDLCTQLKPGQALVDYLRYQRSDPLSSPAVHYLAYVLTARDCLHPLRIDLGKAEPIERALARYRELIAAGASAERLRRQSVRIRQQIWDPLAIDQRWVWVIPDGALGAFPFGALAKKTRFLLESTTFSYLSSSRELIRLAQLEPSTSRAALVVGGIDYGQIATKTTDRSSDLGAGLPPFGPLPASLTEASSIVEILKSSSAAEVTLLSGPAAHEKVVKATIEAKALVHIASHAFFSDDQPATAAEFNPMLLSGVVLAGANQEQRLSGAEDGILTGAEIASLDLRQAELVTLSGCNTGRGKVMAGEGILGLRRAFAAAGARALTLSLWRVADDDTMRLMKDFYQQMKQFPSMDKAQALRQAQLKMLQKKRQILGQADPRSWASFVVSGR